MNIFEIVLLNTVLSISPLLCYFIYVFFEKTLDNKKNDLFLDCALFTSFYLLIKFGNLVYQDIPVILFDVPLIVAYIKNRRGSIILLSILIIFYCHDVLKLNIYFMILEYSFYFMLYLLKSKFRKLNFVSTYLLFKILVFYQYVYFNKIYIVSGFERYLYFIVIVLFFYILIEFIMNILKNIDTVSEFHGVTMNIEDEKRTKHSLFKITHEIKNPIAVCKGYLDMFDVNDAKHSKKYIPILKEEVNRLLILLEDFLSIHKVKIEKEEMDLSLLLEDINNSFSLMLKGKSIELIYKEIDDTYIEADYNRLKQVLVNLIKNSMEAVGENGIIKLSVVKKQNKIKIIIEDNGIGMSEEELSRIKEAFFTTKRNGTGLGIYLSNEIIIKHDGTIDYVSTKNEGTKVTINLPYKKDIKVS